MYVCVVAVCVWWLCLHASFCDMAAAHFMTSGDGARLPRASKPKDAFCSAFNGVKGGE